jgi:hypothetical protein
MISRFAYIINAFLLHGCGLFAARSRPTNIPTKRFALTLSSSNNNGYRELVSILNGLGQFLRIRAFGIDIYVNIVKQFTVLSKII